MYKYDFVIINKSSITKQILFLFISILISSSPYNFSDFITNILYSFILLVIF